MVLCWAPDCKHYNVRETCKFFKFPVDGKERNRWKKLVRRIEEPGPGAFICSCHFKDGKRENGSTLFAHNEMTTFGEHHLSPEKKKSRPSDTTTTANQGLFVESSGGCPGLKVNVEVANIPSTSSACFTSPSLLEAENFFLKKDYEEASQKLENLSSRFGYEHIAKDDAMILLYTGLPNSTIFLALLEMLQDVEINYYLDWKVESINRTDQLLLTLMKLRQNFPHADLAQRFKCSKATITNIVITWIHVMYDTLYLQLMENIPSRRKNVSCLPSSFATFTNCRIIIDCTEIGTAVDRKSMSKQKATYSSYKHKNTWKGLVGVGLDYFCE